MARFAVGLVFGVVVGVVGGAALGLHAQDEGGQSPDAELSEPSAEVPTPTPEPTYGIWDKLHACEAPGSWATNTGNGYYGGLQEDLVFWRRHGGLAYASRPDLASRTAQIAVAERGLAVQGWLAWPTCSRRLGLR